MQREVVEGKLTADDIAVGGKSAKGGRQDGKVVCDAGIVVAMEALDA